MGEGKYNIQGEMHGSAVGDGATTINVENMEGDLHLTVPAPKQASTPDAYLEALTRYCDEHPYISLPGSRRERPPLSTLYVRRRVRQQEEESPAAEGPPRRRVRQREGEPPEAKEPAPRRQPTVEAVRAHSSLVLLGEPGAGKSTWAYHTARQVAQGKGEAVGVAEPYLPLLVRLGLVAARGEGPFTEHLKATLEAELSLTLPDDFFTTWPRQAKCKGWLLICDGLDEVRDERMRRNFVRHLERLAEAGHRVLITSRPGGYERTAPRFPTFELEPFTPEEAETFLRHWFGAFLPPEEAEAKVRGLLEMAHRRHLTGLLANPLLVTVMAVVYHEQGTLATRRPALYREFIEVMLREAEERGMQAALAKESGLTETQAGDLIALTHDLLARVALAMQQRGGTEEEALAEALVPFLQEEMGKGRHIVRRYAAAWLRVVGRWSGVLVQRGMRYEFLHPTFREYLAARALAEAHGSDPAALWAELEPHLLEEEWAEVIPLTLAHLENATLLIEQLLEANAEDEDQQRPLFRAAAALADGATVKGPVKQQVLKKLADLRHPRREWRHFVEKVLGILETMDCASSLQTLHELAQDETLETMVHIRVHEALGKRGERETAINYLRSTAQATDTGNWERTTAIRALGKLGDTSGLAELARDEQLACKEQWDSILIRNEAVEALGNLRQHDLLFEISKDLNINPEIRLQAIQAMIHSGAAERVTPILIRIAQDAPASVRERAAEELIKIGYVDDGVSVLRTLIEGSETPAWVRIDAARALGRRGKVEEVVPVLADVLLEETDTMTRRRAAKVAKEIHCVEPVLSIILPYINNLNGRDTKQIGRVRQAITAAGMLGHTDSLLAFARGTRLSITLRQWIVDALREAKDVQAMRILATDPAIPAAIRVPAAQALGEVGRSEEAAPLLLALAQEEKGTLVGFEAAEALGKLGHREEAAPILYAIAQSEKADEVIRKWAADILRRWGYKP